MYKFTKWLYVICTLAWTGVLIYSLCLENANYKLLFISATITVILLNIANLICLIGEEHERKAKRNSLKPRQ